MASKSTDLIPVDYEIWAVMQHRVYHRQIHGLDELKWWLIVWCRRRPRAGDRKQANLLAGSLARVVPGPV